MAGARGPQITGSSKKSDFSQTSIYSKSSKCAEFKKQSTEVSTTQTYKFKSEGAKETANSVTAISTTIDFLRRGVTTAMTDMVRMDQVTLSMTRANWNLAAAQREVNRWGVRNYQLDVRRAEVQLKLAERQRLITQRTGRQLDVEMANIDVQMAARDIQLQRFGVEDKRKELNQKLYSSGKELSILEQERNLIMVQMGANTTSMAMATIGYAMASRQAAAAAAAQGVASSGAAAIPVGIAIGAGILSTVGTVLAAIPVIKQGTSEPGGLQYGDTEYGDIKQVSKDGVIYAHSPEYIMQPSTAAAMMGGGIGKANIVINVNGSRSSQDETASAIQKRIIQQTNSRSHVPAGVF